LIFYSKNIERRKSEGGWVKSVASAELHMTCGDSKSHRRKIIQQRSGGSHTKSPFQSTNWRTMPPWQALKMILYN